MFIKLTKKNGISSEVVFVNSDNISYILKNEIYFTSSDKITVKEDLKDIVGILRNGGQVPK